MRTNKERTKSRKTDDENVVKSIYMRGSKEERERNAPLLLYPKWSFIDNTENLYSFIIGRAKSMQILDLIQVQVWCFNV